MDQKLLLTLTNFAARFCNEVEKNGSSVCSPLSAQAVLALTALGCTGASRAELLAAMDLSDDEAIRSSFGFLTSTLKSVVGITLRMANRVYVTKNGTLKPAIKKDAEEVFGSGLEQLDFTESDAAAGVINRWVAEQTNDMITGIVSPSSLDSRTRLLLVNAIYFQGLWETPFDKSLTQDRTFHVNNTKEIQVPMMFMENTRFDYSHSKALKAQMYYLGRLASMVIVLPDEVEGLGDVMRQLAAGHDLMDEIARLSETPLDVVIPKFKIETEIDLKELLPKMGIKSIFDEDKSDIRMLTSNERLFVHRAVQKAVIEVDEAGTEAAACTLIGYDCCSISLLAPNLRFVADRPFLCVLLARGLPVFLATYYH